jgi:ferredoxin
MSINKTSALTAYLQKFTEAEWLSAIEAILPAIHEADKKAVQIWFRFFPLELHRHVVAASDRNEMIRGFALQGDFELKNQIDTSHHFLYGHRYWPNIKRSILSDQTLAEEGSALELAETVRSVATRAAADAKVEISLVIAISAVGLMTLNQVGMEAFKASAGEVKKPTGIMAKSPDAVVAERAKDDSQGVLGFLRTVDKKFSVNFTGPHYAGKFPIRSEEEIASASQKDRSRDWRAEDERSWEGPVPIECTAASCGTCWVGVLGGAEKLTPVERRERRQVKVFGYNQPADEQPFIRLACQARATGNVTIVIPPWNGVFGKKVYGNIEDVELEPVTTSAKKLRETISSAAKPTEN